MLSMFSHKFLFFYFWGVGACVIVTYHLITRDMLINRDHSWLRWNCTSNWSQAFSVVFWLDFLPSHRHTNFTLLWNCVTIIYYIQYCEPSELSALVWVDSLHEYDTGKAIVILLWNTVLPENSRIIHSLPMSLAATTIGCTFSFLKYFIGHIVYSYRTNSQHLYSVLQISKKLTETVEP